MKKFLFFFLLSIFGIAFTLLLAWGGFTLFRLFLEELEINIPITFRLW